MPPTELFGLPIRQLSSWAASRLTCPASILGTLWQDAFCARVLQWLDTFVYLMKGARMSRLLPLGNFFLSQGLPSGHKNYWVSLAVTSQNSLEEGFASHPLSTPDLSLQTLMETSSCKSVAELMWTLKQSLQLSNEEQAFRLRQTLVWVLALPLPTYVILGRCYLNFRTFNFFLCKMGIHFQDCQKDVRRQSMMAFSIEQVFGACNLNNSQSPGSSAGTLWRLAGDPRQQAGCWAWVQACSGAPQSQHCSILRLRGHLPGGRWRKNIREKISDALGHMGQESRGLCTGKVSSGCQPASIRVNSARPVICKRLIY